MSRKILLKNELFRFVIIDNQAILDIEQKIQKRGNYIIKDKEVINSQKTKNILVNKLKIENANDFIEQINNSL
ncbi:MAG: DUF448 domain-containing protein [Mycoplasma sp.]